MGAAGRAAPSAGQDVLEARHFAQATDAPATLDTLKMQGGPC